MKSTRLVRAHNPHEGYSFSPPCTTNNLLIKERLGYPTKQIALNGSLLQHWIFHRMIHTRLG